MPRFYTNLNAPTSPEQGDLQYNITNNRLEVYNGSSWANITFGTTTVGALTATSVTTSAGFASTNSTGPVFYIPNAAGTVTGAVASLSGRTPIVYNTTGRAFMVRDGGSWFTTASLSIA